MRSLMLIFMLAVVASACDDARVYEKNFDFEHRYWLANEKPEFEFEIPDNSVRYNVYFNVRNSVSFPYSRLFFKYHLQDTTGNEVEGKLVPSFLFDQHTGKPEGSSGVGDIYDHRIPLLSNFAFPKPGKYKVSFEQFMRQDTLEGIMAVGVRLEKVGL